MSDHYAGYFEHNLDPKNRITIPTKFREQLGKNVAMMRGRNCVELYSDSEWRRICEKYDQVEREDEVAYDNMRRLMLTSMDDNEVDKQGRVLMPSSMCKYAKLEKEIVIAGAGRHVEVWNREDFMAFIGGA